MSTIGGDYARGCQRAVVIRIISLLVGVPLILLCAILPTALVIRNELPTWTLALSLGLFLIVLFAGSALYVWIVLSNRRKRFDAAFTPLGLTGQAYLTFFRQYHGTIEGRQVSVYFRRGPVLEIELSTSLQTRLGVTGPHGDTRILASLAGHQPLSFAEPAMASLTVFALDQPWARGLLADPQTVDLLQRLTSLQGSYTRQQVVLRPGTLAFMLSGSRRTFGFDLDPQQVRQWLDDLLALLAAAEAAPSPTVLDATSDLERASRSLRKRNPYLAVWAGLAILVGILLCSAIIFAGLLLLRP